MSSSLSPRSAGRIPVGDSEDFTTSGSEGSGTRVRRSKRLAAAKRSPRSGRSMPTNGVLVVPSSPTSPEQAGRETSAASPLGLIPIHSHFKSFIHRHEIPRKALHVSIGFVTLSLYTRGYQTSQIHPVLLGALVPIATVDVLRHNFPTINRAYITVCGALMRESEVAGYNGVIWYLAGTWAVLRFAPKDVGVVSVLLLSWCDTAASTVGRALGRYTWRLRRGKSAAGSAAALVTGVLTAWVFWGWAVPVFGTPGGFDAPPNGLAFTGALQLPSFAKELLGWKSTEGVVSGLPAVGILSLWTGIAASASEAVDLFSWDDNFTIPVLCGIGIYGFLKAFGAS